MQQKKRYTRMFELKFTCNKTNKMFEIINNIGDFKSYILL